MQDASAHARKPTESVGECNAPEMPAIRAKRSINLLASEIPKLHHYGCLIEVGLVHEVSSASSRSSGVPETPDACGTLPSLLTESEQSSPRSITSIDDKQRLRKHGPDGAISVVSQQSSEGLQESAGGRSPSAVGVAFFMKVQVLASSFIAFASNVSVQHDMVHVGSYTSNVHSRLTIS